MSPVVQLVLSILAALPQETAIIAGAIANVKGSLAAPDLASLQAIMAALDAKTDADVSKLDADALAHGAT